MMKKGILGALIILFVVVAAIVAPAEDKAYAAAKLTAPGGITLVMQNGSYAITWGQVVGNNGYTVEIDGATSDTAVNVNAINADNLTTGVVHKVRVMTLSSDGQSNSDYTAYTDIVKSGKLSAPTNVNISGLVLTWTAVTNATSYKVTINGVVIEASTAATSVDLSGRLNCTGDYIVKIKAQGNNVLHLDSDYSAVYTYTHTKILSTPTNLTVSSSGGVVTASWDNVPYANGYEINVDGAVYTTQNCSYDVTLLVSAIADHNIKVRAKDSGNYKASEYASAIYATTAEITSPVLTVSGDNVSWTKPTGADRFSVVVLNTGGEVYKNTEFDGTILNMATITAGKPAGEYVVKVQALKNANYNASDIATVSYIKYEKLAQPSLTINGGTVAWSPIQNAVNYTVKIDGRVLTSTLEGTAYDISSAVAEIKTYTVTVSANAVGWYLASDEATINYSYLGKLGTTDVTADGLTVNWAAVLGASTYAVTVDGVKVKEGITALTYDVSSVCSVNKQYVIGVYAEAHDGYSAADVATVTVTGAAAKISTKTYNLKITASENYVYFVDGVKTTPITKTVGGVQAVELPSTAQKLIVVTDAEALTVYTDVFENTMLYPEFDLTQAVYDENSGTYLLNVAPLAVITMSDELQPAGVTEGYDYLEVDGKKYYYHVKPGGNIPTSIG